LKVRDEDIVLSPDGSTVAYAASVDQNWPQTVVVGSNPGARYLTVHRPVFNATTCDQVAFRVADSFDKPPRWSVVLAEEGEVLWEKNYGWYGFVTGLSFKPDDGALAQMVGQDVQRDSVGYRGGRWSVMVAGKSESEFSALSRPVFSPDGNRMAYAASASGWARYDEDGNGFVTETSHSDEWKVLLDGTPQKTYRWVEGLVFSPDGAHFAYVARRGFTQDGFVVLDTKELTTYPEVQDPLFGPNNALAYVAKNGSRSFLVVDGKEHAEFDYVTDHVFSTDGKVAYVVGRGGKESVATGNKVGPRYDSVRAPHFSPDGTRLAHFAEEEGRWFIVVDGKKGEEFQAVHGARFFENPYRNRSNSPVFSQDGAKVAYAAKKGNRWSLVVNGIMSSPYDYVFGDPTFSADGRQVAFGARSGDELWWRVWTLP
jgi:hypothetical protein